MSIVAGDAMVLKHQVINSHNIVFHTKPYS